MALLYEIFMIKIDERPFQAEVSFDPKLTDISHPIIFHITNSKRGPKLIHPENSKRNKAQI